MTAPCARTCSPTRMSGRRRALARRGPQQARFDGRPDPGVGGVRGGRSRDRGERSLRRRSLGAGLGLEHHAYEGTFARAREARTGLEYLWPADAIVREGLWLELGLYDYRVYLDWRVVADGPGASWARLASTLGGRGVPSLDDALRDLDLEPVHAALAAVLAAGAGAARREAAARLVGAVRDATGARGGAKDAEVIDRIERGLASIDGSVGRGATPGRAAPSATATDAPAGRGRAARRTVAAPAETLADPTTRVAMRARTVIAALGRLGDATDVQATATAWFTDLRLGPALERILGASGRSDAPEAVHRTWLLLRLPASRGAVTKAATGTGRSKTAPNLAAALAAGWLADDDLRTFLGVHEAGGTTWLRSEPLGTLAGWSLALAAAEGGDTVAAAEALDRVVGAVVEAGYAIDGWLARLDGARSSPAKRPATKPRRRTLPRRRRRSSRRDHHAAADPAAQSPKSSSRRTGIGGEPWPMTRSRCSR